MWWISQRDGTNVFKGTDAPGALWAILRLCSAVFKTCIRESSGMKYLTKGETKELTSLQSFLETLSKEKGFEWKCIPAEL